MGSFQQISIGAVCLIAAFAFGNYVNTHPSGELPHDFADVDADSVSPIGNIHSRLTSGIELIEKQPAPIVTMRNRLQPRFSMPQSNSTLAQSSDAKPNRLPPPNQLAVNKDSPRKSGTTPLSSIDSSNAPPGASSQKEDVPSLSNFGPTGITPLTAAVSDVPDFSSIMNELEGTPIALPPLGKMPRHTSSPNQRSAQAIAKPRNANPRSPLKDLAGEFKMATQPRENDAPDPWRIEHQTEFSAADFSPQLKDSFPGDALKTRQPTVKLGQLATSSSADPQSLANHYADIPESSNHIVSRASIPPKPIGAAHRDDSPGRLAAIENLPDAGFRIAQATPQGQSALEPNPNERNRSVLQNPVDQNRSANLVRQKLPFALNDQGRQTLVAIKSRAKSQLALNTTKFVDHVVQPGETLQSISKRYFGNPDFYLDIYLANRTKLKNPVNVASGIAIRIPIYE